MTNCEALLDSQSTYCSVLLTIPALSGHAFTNFVASGFSAAHKLIVGLMQVKLHLTVFCTAKLLVA